MRRLFALEKIMTTAAGLKEQQQAFTQRYRAGDFAAALAIIEPLASAYPDRPGMQWSRIRCLSALGYFGECLAALENFLILQPEHDQAKALHARLKQQLLGP